MDYGLKFSVLITSVGRIIRSELIPIPNDFARLTFFTTHAVTREDLTR